MSAIVSCGRLFMAIKTDDFLHTFFTEDLERGISIAMNRSYSCLFGHVWGSNMAYPRNCEATVPSWEASLNDIQPTPSSTKSSRRMLWPPQRIERGDSERGVSVVCNMSCSCLFSQVWSNIAYPRNWEATLRDIQLIPSTTPLLKVEDGVPQPIQKILRGSSHLGEICHVVVSSTYRPVASRRPNLCLLRVDIDSLKVKETTIWPIPPLEKPMSERYLTETIRY